jgi:hypothetical protein
MILVATNSWFLEPKQLHECIWQPLTLPGSEATNNTMVRATKEAAGGGQSKRAIKKLTKEKIDEYKDEIVGGRGGQAADLAGRGMEAIVSLHGLKHVTKMDLSRNKLTKLADMKRVPNLTMLKLTGNKLNGEVRALAGCTTGDQQTRGRRTDENRELT